VNVSNLFRVSLEFKFYDGIILPDFVKLNPPKVCLD